MEGLAAPAELVSPDSVTCDECIYIFHSTEELKFDACLLVSSSPPGRSIGQLATYRWGIQFPYLGHLGTRCAVAPN
jgi:hypothetical protein